MDWIEYPLWGTSQPIHTWNGQRWRVLYILHHSNTSPKTGIQQNPAKHLLQSTPDQNLPNQGQVLEAWQTCKLSWAVALTSCLLVQKVLRRWNFGVMTSSGRAQWTLYHYSNVTKMCTTRLGPNHLHQVSERQDTKRMWMAQIFLQPWLTHACESHFGLRGGSIIMSNTVWNLSRRLPSTPFSVRNRDSHLTCSKTVDAPVHKKIWENAALMADISWKFVSWLLQNSTSYKTAKFHFYAKTNFCDVDPLDLFNFRCCSMCNENKLCTACWSSESVEETKEEEYHSHQQENRQNH